MNTATERPRRGRGYSGSCSSLASTLDGSTVNLDPTDVHAAAPAVAAAGQQVREAYLVDFAQVRLRPGLAGRHDVRDVERQPTHRRERELRREEQRRVRGRRALGVV